MRVLVLVLNYFLLFFVVLGLIHGIFVEGQQFGVNWNAVIGLCLFLVVTVFNLIYIHKTRHIACD